MNSVGSEHLKTEEVAPTPTPVSEVLNPIILGNDASDKALINSMVWKQSKKQGMEYLRIAKNVKKERERKIIRERKRNEKLTK